MDPNVTTMQICAMVSFYFCTYSKHKLCIRALDVSHFANRAVAFCIEVLRAASLKRYVCVCECVCVCVVCESAKQYSNFTGHTQGHTNNAEAWGDIRMC